MTESEARAILLRYLTVRTRPKCPLAWVGDMFEEDDIVFSFQGTIHAQDEDPRENFQHWHVVKRDGRCVMDME